MGPGGEYFITGSLVGAGLGSGRGGGGVGVWLRGASIIWTWSSNEILRLGFCIWPPPLFVFFSVDTEFCTSGGLACWVTGLGAGAGSRTAWRGGEWRCAGAGAAVGGVGGPGGGSKGTPNTRKFTEFEKREEKG